MFFGTAIDKLNSIFSKFARARSKRGVIFVHTDTNLHAVSEKKDVILSPGFYWCKKERLGVKTARAAKKFSQSVFFSQLPAGNFDYKAIKDGDDFYFFAYDAAQIAKSLEAQGLRPEFLGNVYFAQTEIKSELAVRVGSNFALTKRDDLVLIAPAWFFSQMVNLKDLNISLSSNKIKIKMRSQKGAAGAGHTGALAIAAVWAVAFLALDLYLYSGLEDLRRQEEALAAKYPLAKTSFELEAMQRRYAAFDKNQAKIRAFLGLVASFKTDEANYFSLIELRQNKFRAVYVSADVQKAYGALRAHFKGAKITSAAGEINIEQDL